MARDPIFARYVDQLTTLEFYKYDVVINYFDLKFKYKNINANQNATFTFKVEAIVNFIEPRDYLVYQKTKPTAEANEWVVRLPEINNNKIPAYNQGASTYNVSKIPWKQFIDVGLNYDINTQDKFSTEGPVSKYIGIYQHATTDQTAGSNNIVLYSDPSLGENGPNFISTNTSAVISDFVSNNFYRYNREHPCLLVNYDPPPSTGNNQTPQDPEYFKIPIAPSRYRITLTNNQNQEKVVSYLEGTLFANPAYSPIQQIFTTFTPPTSSVSSLTLNLYAPQGPANPNNNNVNPPLSGVPAGTGNAGYGGGGIGSNTGYVYPAQYDQGHTFADNSGEPGGVGAGGSSFTVAGQVFGTVEEPIVVGMEYNRARQALIDAGFNNVTTQVGIQAGNSGQSYKVYIQSPVGGVFRDSSTAVRLTYYSGYVASTSTGTTGGSTSGGTSGTGGTNEDTNPGPGTGGPARGGGQ